MKAELKTFNHEQFGKIRTVMIKGKIMFMATDIAKALGYKNPRHAIINHCKKGDVNTMTTVCVDINNQEINIKVIDESNLYLLVMRSKLPDAINMQSWVCKELIPFSFKKDRNFIEETKESPNKIMAQALLIAQDTIEVKQSQIDSLEVIVNIQHKEIETLLPKAEYYDEGMELQGAYTITQIAKGLGMSSQKLNQLLYKWRIQYRQTNTWLLYATYQNQGYMRIVPEFKTKKNGETYSHPKSVWTEKGRAFIHKLVKEYTV